MALTKLDQMYRAVILDEAQHPRHHGVLPAFDHEITVTDVAFSGSGCTISQASASLMTEQIIGKTPADIEQMVETFSDLIINGDVPNADILGDAAVLKGVHQFPARIKCATLAWKAAAQVLTQKGEDHD